MKNLKTKRIAMLATAMLGFVVARSDAVDDLSLNVDPGSVAVAVGDPVTVTLDVGNLSAGINGVQVLLGYDNTLLQLDAITPNATIAGVGWDEAIETDFAGDVTYVVVMNSAGSSTIADHTIATISFTAIATGSTSVTFRPDNPPMMTKLTVASDNSTILPNITDSGNLTIGSPTGPKVTNLEMFYAGKFANAADPTFSFFGAGSTATIANISYHSQGITGIRVFFDSVVDFATLDPRDALTFAWTDTIGTVFTPVTDAATNITATASVLGGATVVSIVLADDHVRRRWLRVTLDATQVSTGGVALDGEITGNPSVLPSGDGVAGGDAVFYFGNMPGDIDGDLLVTLDDVIAIREQVNPFLSVPITSVFDVDKDSVVTLDDVIGVRVDVNPFIALTLITP